MFNLRELLALCAKLLSTFGVSLGRTQYLATIGFLRKLAEKTQNSIDDAALVILEDQGSELVWGHWAALVQQLGGSPVVMSPSLSVMTAEAQELGCGAEVGELVADLEAEGKDQGSIGLIIMFALELLRILRSLRQ